MNTDVENLSVTGGTLGSVYLDCKVASFKNRKLSGLMNNQAHISEISGGEIICNKGNYLQNEVDGKIDKIENCDFKTVPEGSNAIYNNDGTISQINGGIYYSCSWMNGAALRNTGTVSDISGDAKFYGANAIKNEDNGTITVNSAMAVGNVDASWAEIPIGYKIYAYAVNAASSGNVTINGGNFGCGVYRGDSDNDLKLFPDNNGITINGGISISRFRPPSCQQARSSWTAALKTSPIR